MKSPATDDGMPGGSARVTRASRQSAKGDNNVQINDAPNANITIIHGGALRKVPLERAITPPGRNAAPSRLLRARAGILGFVDLGGLLAELNGWLTEPDEQEFAFACTLIAGKGGLGKTRLGVELCEHARDTGWLAGLLASSYDLEQVEVLAAVRCPRLIVIDYAETRVAQLNALLPELRSGATGQYPVRVLLLTRTGTTGDSSAEVIKPLRNGAADPLDSILDDVATRLLDRSPLTAEDQKAVFRTHARSFLARGGRAEDPAPTTPDFITSGDEPNPLFLTIAAYLAVHSPTQVPSSRVDLLKELERHEDHYWESHAGASHEGDSDRLGLDSAKRARVVAFATLAGATSEDEAAELLRLLPDFTDANAERRGELARWAHKLYLGEHWWNPVEPDLFAEHLVAEHMANAQALSGVLNRANPASLAQPLRLMALTVSDFPQFEAPLGQALTSQVVRLTQVAVGEAHGLSWDALLRRPATVAAGVSSLVGGMGLPLQRLMEASNEIPGITNLILSPLALQLHRTIADGLRPLAAANPAAYTPNLATSLNNYANLLSEVGRRDEALAPAEEAVTLRRTLAAANPAAYTPNLATSLNNYANRLAEVGRRDEAEAIRRELAALPTPG